jgi:hypothetical protein
MNKWKKLSSPDLVHFHVGSLTTTDIALPTTLTLRLAHFGYTTPWASSSLLARTAATFAGVLSTPLPPEHFAAIRAARETDDLEVVTDPLLYQQNTAFRLMNPESSPTQ